MLNRIDLLPFRFCQIFASQLIRLAIMHILKKNTVKMLIPLDSGDPGKIERKTSSLFVDNHRISHIFE